MKRAHQFIATAAVIVAMIASAPAVDPALAQNWPTHPMTLVVPFSAGGSSDAIARIVADGISNNLRQPVVVENVTGAGGLLGGSRVARSTPDGYQFVIGNVGTFAQSQWLYKQPLYNSVTDFAPVALLTDESLVLVARNMFPPITCSSSLLTRKRTKTNCTTLRRVSAAPIIWPACCSIPQSASRSRTFLIATSYRGCRMSWLVG